MNSIGTIALILALGTVAVFFIHDLIEQVKARIDQLREAQTAASDFFDSADLLLADPAVPSILKDMVWDIGSVLSNGEARQRATHLIANAIKEMDQGKRVRPKREILVQLDLLRRSRGDLYDAFHEALRAAISTIMLGEGSHAYRHNVGIRYNAIGMNKPLLNLAETIDRVVAHSEGRPQSGVPTSALA